MSKYCGISFIFMLFLLAIFIQNAKPEDPKAFKNSGRLNGLPIDYSSGDHQSLLSSLVKGQEGGILGLAERFLEEKLKTQAIQYNVSSTCLNHTEIFLQELLAGQTWALKSKSLHNFLFVICIFVSLLISQVFGSARHQSLVISQFTFTF